MTRPVQRPASNSDARKRAVGYLAEDAVASTLEKCAALLSEAVENRGLTGLDEHDSGYVDGWNAAARFFAASFLASATGLRAGATS